MKEMTQYGLIDKLKKKKTDHMYLYTDKELDEYEKYIEETFGNYQEVFHEIVSTDIHLDILLSLPQMNNLIIINYNGYGSLSNECT